MTHKLTTVGQLMKLLETLPQEAELRLADAPGVTGWTRYLTDAVHLQPGLVVLAPHPEACPGGEMHLSFQDAEGNPVRF